MSRSIGLGARSLLVVALFAPSFANAQPAPLQPGGVNVRVTRAGQPVANTTVCVGIVSDLNRFFQGLTDPQGRVHFASVPGEPFVVTANSAGRGAQQSRSFDPSANVPVVSVEISLPATGGPACPATAAGPSRPLAPLRDMAPPTAPPRPTTITLSNTQFCFGALGAECGQPQGLIPPTALCANGSCLINGGSWDHDECCFDSPRGMACRFGPADAVTGHDGTCVNEWNMALLLVSKGLSWRRNVDFSRGNTTGTVEFNLYCAPANSLLPPAHGNKCCARQTRPLTGAEGAAAAIAGLALAACA